METQTWRQLIHGGDFEQIPEHHITYQRVISIKLAPLCDQINSNRVI